jgi:hypothetical protein
MQVLPTASERGSSITPPSLAGFAGVPASDRFLFAARESAFV